MTSPFGVSALLTSKDSPRIGESDAADDDETSAAQLLNRGAVVRNDFAKLAEHELHRGAGVLRFRRADGRRVQRIGMQPRRCVVAGELLDLLLELRDASP
jgi:hypothetical protein